MEDSEYLNNLKTVLIDPVISNGSQIIGETDNFEIFFKQLLVLGYGFVKDKSAKYEGETTKYRFTLERGGIPIKFMGCPFVIKKHIYYECVNGTQKKTDNYSTNDHPTNTRKKIRLQSTKKYNCSAVMTMVKITYFPEYEITESSLTKWRIKKQILANLKNDFGTGKQIHMKDKYLIVVSLPSVHNHSIETSLLNLSIDKSVRDEISRLVINGFSNVKIIQSMLKDFVEQSCSITPSNLSRAFYPNERTIKHFITKFTNEKHQIKIDQNDLQIKITQWEISRPKDHFYLRPFSKENGITKLFLFCQQTEWQRYLLNRYGNVCFLDATYKTTNDVPLFFLIVKTNVNYCVAASFFVQCKDSKSIEEALHIFKSWNTTWSPQYFLTDYCEAEYKAITKVFNCPSYICDFYREQAWLRWTNTQGNLHNKEYQTELLALWKNIANSSDEDEFSNKVESMKLTEAWLKNPKAQEYFIETWLPIEEKWTDKFFKLEYDFKVATNNGVESQNKLIKQFYLELLADKSLNSILENIIEHFLPQTLYKYQKKNFKLAAHHNQISNDLPTFLYGRPKTFVKHVYGRYAIAQSIHNKKKIKKLQLEHQFEVQDENGSNLYVVDFQKPSCTCLDFKKYHWPCIHFCELFIYVPGYTFNNLPDKYKNSVYISPDLQYSKKFKDEKMIVTSSILQSHTKTNYFNPHENTSTENVENQNSIILIQYREILKKITDLTYLIDQKEYSTNLTKQLEVLKNVHNKMSGMVKKKMN